MDFKIHLIYVSPRLVRTRKARPKFLVKAKIILFPATYGLALGPIQSPMQSFPQNLFLEKKWV